MRLMAVILEREGFRLVLHKKSKVQKTKLVMNAFAKKKSLLVIILTLLFMGFFMENIVGLLCCNRSSGSNAEKVA